MKASDPPSDYVCPISLSVMELPVVTHTGHTYDRASIEHWWFGVHQRTCPATGQQVDSVHLVVNVQLYAAIRQWQEAHCTEEATRSDIPQAVSMRTLVPSTKEAASTFQQAVFQLFQRDDASRCAALVKLMDMLPPHYLQPQAQKPQPSPAAQEQAQGDEVTNPGRQGQAPDVGDRPDGPKHTQPQPQHQAQIGAEQGTQDTVPPTEPASNQHIIDPSWMHCLLTSGAYLELLHLCTHALPCHRWRAAYLLQELARGGPHARDVLLSAQYLPTLLAALREPDADAALQLQVARSLLLLASTKQLREVLINAKVVSCMMDLLYSDSDTRLTALQVLVTLLKARKGAEKLSNSTCIRVLVNLLGQEDLTDSVVASVLSICTTLVKIDKNKAKLVAQGCIPQLLKILRKVQSGKTPTHAPASSLMNTLLADTAAAVRYFKQGGINNLVDMLTDKGVPQVSRSTVRTLLQQLTGTVPPPSWGWSWFSSPPPTVSQAMVDGSAVTALVRLSAYEAEYVYAITLLRILACARHITNKNKFLEEGAVSMLVDALTSTKEAAVQEAALALGGLGSDAKLRDAARQAGALQQLKTVASKGNADRRELLQVVMRRLMGFEGDLTRYRGSCQSIKSAFQAPPLPTGRP